MIQSHPQPLRKHWYQQHRCFGALDVATHLAEEIRQPERMIPMSIMLTVAVGLVTSLTYTIAMFFSLADFEAIVTSLTGVPILELYYQTTRSFAGAVILELFVILTGFGCLVACRKFLISSGLPSQSCVANLQVVQIHGKRD